MAISRLTAPSKWIELASSSPTSGTVVSFTSIPEYRDYKFVVSNMDTAASGSYLYNINFNNDTGANYGYVFNNTSISSAGGDTKIKLSAVRFDNYFDVLILGANQISKEIYINHYGFSIGTAMWDSQSTINRIDLTAPTTISSGTVKVYGRN